MDQTLDSKNLPLVSVILATYNGQKYLHQAIDSVLNQSYKNLELVIVDDGSEDHTFLIAQKYRHDDERVRLIQQKNKGVGPARNYGVKEAKGSLIALIDDDDFWEDKQKIQKQVYFLEENLHHVLIGGAMTKIVNEAGVLKYEYNLPKSDEEIRNTFLMRNCFVTSSVMFRKEIFFKAGEFKSMKLAEDYDLWLRMGHFGLMANIDCIANHRERRASVSSQRKLDMYKTVLKIVKKQHGKYPKYWLGMLKGYARIIHYKLFH